jgi:hypothetical protein
MTTRQMMTMTMRTWDIIGNDEDTPQTGRESPLATLTSLSHTLKSSPHLPSTVQDHLLRLAGTHFFAFFFFFFLVFFFVFAFFTFFDLKMRANSLSASP